MKNLIRLLINVWCGRKCETCCYWNEPRLSQMYRYCKRQESFKFPDDGCVNWKQRKSKKGRKKLK